MPAKPSPTMLRRQLGAELRRLRDRTGRTVVDVARQLGWSESKLSRIETAAIGIKTSDLERLIGLYTVDGAERNRLRAMANQARQKAWWEAYGNALPSAYEAYIGFESEASAIRTYEATLVPGLLQTAEYAAATISVDLADDPALVSQRVAVRMARQAVLAREPQPELWAILDEAVLRRPIGGPDVMRRQLLRLVEAADRPAITLQVIPFQVGAHAALAGSFVVLDFDGRAGDQPLVYSEGITGGLFRNRAEDLQLYRDRFEALRAVALSMPESVEMISVAARG